MSATVEMGCDWIVWCGVYNVCSVAVHPVVENLTCRTHTCTLFATLFALDHVDDIGSLKCCY